MLYLLNDHLSLYAQIGLDCSLKFVLVPSDQLQASVQLFLLEPKRVMWVFNILHYAFTCANPNVQRAWIQGPFKIQTVVFSDQLSWFEVTYGGTIVDIHKANARDLYLALRCHIFSICKCLYYALYSIINAKAFIE